jgi:hypothetical protein
LVFIPPEAGAHKVPSGKYIGIAHIYLLWMPYDDTISFKKVRAVLDLLGKGLYMLLWVPCATHLLEIFLQINCWDVSIRHENVVQYFLS